MVVKGLLAHVDPAGTPQSEPIPGREADMERNRPGGYAFALDDWTRLDRFLILGSEGGTYYATERETTVENVAVVRRCITVDGQRTVARIADVSEAGRAPRNDTAIIALAMCAKLGDDATRTAAHAALPRVCRIGTHLFAFAEAVQVFGGWSRATRRAVARWYNREDCAYQLVKYRQRNGWTHRDLLRLAHPTPGENAVALAWAVGKGPGEGQRLIEGHERIQAAETAEQAAAVLTEYGLPRECIPSAFAADPAVLSALLPTMPITAMIRNLGNLTKGGLVKPFSDGSALVMDRLGDTERLRAGRVHPMAVLLALRTYAQGHGLRGGGAWTPVPQVVDALDAAFDTCIANVEPTGKRHLLAIDVSGSMGSGYCGNAPITPAEAAAAMALITVRVEPQCYVLGVDTAPRELHISKRMRLDSVTAEVRRHMGGGTDLSIPLAWAMREQVPFDVVCTYTDSETWAGNRHASQSLASYRKAVGLPTRYVEAALTATGTSTADPADPLTMRCVGLDAALPTLIRGFAAGEF